jgi:putative ABC transport system permease protein
MLFEGALRELRIASRALSRTRGVAASAVLTLAVASSATTLIFAVVEGVLLRPLPVNQPDRLVVAWSERRKSGATHWPFRATEIDEIKKTSRVFSSVAGVDYNGAGRLVVLENGSPAYMKCAAVTGEFFDVLGVPPLIGRTLSHLDDVSGAPGVLVLAHGFWEQRYGGDPGIVGRTVTISGRPFTVVGVMPADVEFPRSVEAWMTVAANTAILTNPSFRIDLDLIGRIRPNATLADATGELESIGRRLDEEAAASSRRPTGLSPVAHLYKEVVVGDVRTGLLLLTVAVALVLLIATANIANLFLVRGEARTMELAVRTALGASRTQLIRHIVVECIVLALPSAAIALLATSLLVPVVVRLVPEGLPRVDSIHVDVGVVVFSLAIGLAAAAAAGLWSALKTTHADLSEELRSGASRSTVRLGQSRRALIASEVAIAVVVIAGAVLLMRSLLALERVEMGLAAEKILFVELELPGRIYSARPAHLQFLKDVVAALQAPPVIAAATPVNVLPFSGTGGWDLAQFTAEEQSVERAASNPSLNLEAVYPTYFDTFQIALSRGRAFTETDRQDEPNVAIVSEDVATQTWPGADPIGKRLKMGTLTSKGPWWTVIGVAKTTRYRDLLQPRPTLYLPAEQFIVAANIIAVRTSAPLPLVASVVRDRLRTVDAEVRAVQIAPFVELTRKPLARPRFDTILLTSCGAVALMLSVIGVYAVISARVRERFAEIGIRVALGATASDVRRLVMAEGLRFVVIGVAIGILLASAAGRLIRNLLYGVGSSDPATLAGTALLLIATSALACYLPARRAMRIDPSILLRTP